LLCKINGAMLAHEGVFPPGGIRSRAIELKDYCVADGSGDDAFVHGTLKIGHGRSESVKKKVCEDIFAVMKEHFADLFAKRYLALSLEFSEFSEAGTYKHNNIHARYKKAQD
jgi:5-carboxymethyl-2-hydroxymuconate isomerase